MDIRVSGHQMDTGDALRTHVEDRLGAMADKYFSRALSAHVTFGKGPHDFVDCDIVAHVMQGLVLKAQGQAQDAHRAFDIAAEKIDKQLRRYMRRLKDKSLRAEQQHSDLVDGLPRHGWTAARENAHYAVFDAGDPENEAGDAPLIIAETRVDVPEASVSDAVMMLDLRNTNALLFVNSGTGAHNMVYRRDDGTIGWVEPQS